MRSEEEEEEAANIWRRVCLLFSERGREKTEKIREEERSELESARERG